MLSAAGVWVFLAAVCFLCFLTLVAGLVVSVAPVAVEEAAGVWAITVPSMRERPMRAEAKVFMVFVYLLFWMPCVSASIMRDVRDY